MGTPESDLDYILDGRTVPEETLSAKAWLKIIRRMLVMTNDYRKDMLSVDDHRLAAMRVHDVTRTRDFGRVWTREAVVSYAPLTPPPHLDGAMRLIPLAPLHPWSPIRLDEAADVGWGDPRDECWVNNRLIDTYLLYGFGWVRLDRTLKREPGRYPRYWATHLTFSELDEAGLMRTIGERPDRWRMMHDSFLTVLREAVEKKRQSIDKIEKVLARAIEMRNRVTPPIEI